MSTATKRRNRQHVKARQNRNNLVASAGPFSSLTKEAFRFMPIFPPRVVKTLRYASFGALSSTSGAVATHVIRANDLFDPDFTSTGHQPMGFDQMMLFYNHFCVVYAKLIVVFKNTSSTTPTVSIRVDADSTPLTVPDRILEFGGVQLENLEVKGVYGCNKTMVIDADICKLQGVNRRAITADTALTGTAAASPAEVTYFHIQMWDNIAATGSSNFDFVLEQTAIFTEPRSLIESLKTSKPPPPSPLNTEDFEICAPPVLRVQTHNPSERKYAPPKDVSRR